MKETDGESQLPKGYRWGDLETKDGVEQLNFYRELLVHLGSKGSTRVKSIFNNAKTSLRQPKNLSKLVQADRYIKDHTDELFDLKERQQVFQKREANNDTGGAAVRRSKKRVYTFRRW